MPIGPHLIQSEPYDITYYGPPILWADGGVPAGELSAGLTSRTWFAYYDTWSESKTVTHQNKSWEFPDQWQRLTTTNVWVKELQKWREDNDEEVGTGGSDPQDDVDVPLLIHPRNADDLEGDPHNKWGAFLTISHEGTIPVFKPVGISRPANWTGSDGLTPQAESGSSNDSWDIAEGSTTAKATFVVPSRYWTRMARLADHTAVEIYHHAFFPYFNRPNVDSTPADGFLDPPADRIPEAEWHWRNYSHLRITFTTAPRNATIGVTVNYSFPSNINDPNYTCFSHRYGTSGEFTYVKTTGTAPYSVDIVAGADASGTIDLKVPLTGDINPELHVIESIDLTFDESVADETWVLDDAYLVLDPTAAPPRPDDHLALRMYDPYNWLRDYTMFAGLVDGVPVFDIRYGYEQFEGTERSLKGRQMRRHCPTSPLSDILDHAKVLALLTAEVGFQRGWSATNNDPENSDENEDEDENRVVTTFRWFDIRECSEARFNGSLEIIGAPRVINYQLAGGVEHTIVHVKFPQGRIHLLMYEEDRSGRQRDTEGIYVWRNDAGVWTLIQGPLTSDGYGRVRTGPHKEHDFSEDIDWTYGVSTADDETPKLYSPMDNRRYWWTLIPSPTEGDGLCVFDQLGNFVYVVYEDDPGIKHVYTSPGDYWFVNHRSQAAYSQPQTVTNDEDTSPTGYVDNNGHIRLYFIRGGLVYRSDSTDWANNWSDVVATPISADKFRVRISNDGSMQFAVSVLGGALIYHLSDDHFVTVQEDQTIATGVDDAQCDVYHGADGLYAYARVSAIVTCWKSTDQGRTWTEQGTV